MHFASANQSQRWELFQPIELQYSVVATWWKYKEPSVKIHYWASGDLHIICFSVNGQVYSTTTVLSLH